MALSSRPKRRTRQTALPSFGTSNRRAERQARKEAKDVETVEQELASEARDREILTVELHKLLEEIELLRPEVAESNT